MEFFTTLDNAQGFIRRFADEIKASVEVDCQRSSLLLPKRIGRGEIIVYHISDGLDAILIDAEFKHDLEITFSVDKSVPVAFYTLASGTFRYSRDSKEQAGFLLEPLQSAISTHPATGRTVWSFARQQEICFICTFMHRQAYLSNVDCDTLEIPTDLLEVVKDIAGQSDFLFQEIFHLPLVTSLQDIVSQEDIGLLNSTFATAKIYEMLFLQLQQYQAHAKGEQTDFVRPDQGMAQIRNAENILTARLQEPPTIPELARMAGLNQQSLKKGFKQLYGETINQYLNTRRLEQAEMLIKNGNLKLKEVALEVGYNNPSYFSRRFREKYGVTPRYYARQIEKESEVTLANQKGGTRATDE